MRVKVLLGITILSFCVTFGLLIGLILLATKPCVRVVARNNIERASSSEYHFVAALVVKQHKKIPRDLLKCVTVIISRYWTVTVAHCLFYCEEYGEKNVVIKSNSPEWRKGKQHRIKQHLAHKNYQLGTVDYNIALIQVIEAFSGSTFAKPASLDYKITINSTAVVLGWDNKSRTLQQRLIKAHVRLFEQTNCEKLFKGLTRKFTPRMMCAGTYTMSSKVCTFNSGAPLVQNNVVLGLLVWDVECKESFQGGVYMSLADFQECLQEVLEDPDYSEDHFVTFNVTYKRHLQL